MLIKLTCFLLSSQVFACSDCFSKCDKHNKNECLLDCGCPLFTTSRVHGGSFRGPNGQLYVPDLDKALSSWVSKGLGCDLSCSQDCSSQYLDSKLESCVQKCGCSGLLSEAKLNENISVQSKCETICRGSPAACAVDCYEHMEGNQDLFYLWVVFPVIGGIFILAWLIIRQKKEDDYVLM